MLSNYVTIVGGGITGLTAAHELVDRGFKVRVVERRSQPFDITDCQVGGLARTQPCSAESIERTIARAVARPEATPGPVVRAEATAGIGAAFRYRILFDHASYRLGPDEIRKLDEMGNLAKSYLIERHAAGDVQVSPNRIVAVEGYASGTEVTDREPQIQLDAFTEYGRELNLSQNIIGDAKRGRPPGEPPVRTLSRLRAIIVVAFLYKYLSAPDLGAPEILLTPLGLGGLPDTDEIPPSVSFKLHEPEVPGEHGYRYFPAFYYHLFDSMKRTPILDPSPIAPIDLLRSQEFDSFWKRQEVAVTRRGTVDTESVRTVYDNLVATLSFAIATGDQHPPTPVSRTRLRSFRELRKLVSVALDQLGVDSRDLARFQMKLAQFMTSSGARRAEYEEVTWWDFLEGERFSEAFQQLIDRWPQALVGIRARLADARTIGTVTVQLLLDQLTSFGLRDGTLNGPTSPAWLDLWQQFLKARGVLFARGELAGLTLTADRATPAWTGDTPDPPEAMKAGFETGYLLLAIPLLETKRAVANLWRTASADDRRHFPESLRALLAWQTDPEASAEPEPALGGGLAMTKSAPERALRHYGGIQFYFLNDLGPADGHLYFSTSEWGISAISQAQSWRQRLMHETGSNYYLSVLSVDIGNWHAPVTSESSAVHDRCAIDCTRAELAEEVYRQIEQGLRQGEWVPPRPVAYHVDDDVIYRRASPAEPERPVSNRAPYLVSLAGDWKKRPGDLRVNRYDVFRRLVVAGTFMKTYTRLTTMESANESARRAVNGILDNFRTVTKARLPLDCRLRDPEDHELDDLDFLKTIDAALHENGLPHLLDILEIESLIDGGLDVLTPDTILTGVLRTLGLQDAATPTVAGLPLALLRRALQALFG